MGFTAYDVAKLYMHNVHGTRCKIVSDRDTLFTSAVWEELSAPFGSKLAMSIAIHPASDD